VNGWQFVVHQEALETIDNLRPAERRAIRAALRVIYWLDAFAREVYIVRVDRSK